MPERKFQSRIDDSGETKSGAAGYRRRRFSISTGPAYLAAGCGTSLMVFRIWATI
jgi:hypothetical protein